MKRKVLRYWKTLIWLAVIFWMLLKPASDIPSYSIFEIPHFDKMVHLGIFAILGFLFSWESPAWKIKKLFLIGLLLATTTALLTEYLQTSLAKGRSGELIDFVADLIGYALGVWGYYIMRRLNYNWGI